MSAPVHAESPDAGTNPETGPWYLRTGIGPEFTTASHLSLDFSQSDVSVKFDPGVRLDVAGGYQFCPYFSVEAATGLIYNRLDSIASSPSTDAGLAQIPFLANVVFQWPNQTRWIPFIGGGCGFIVDEISINQANVQGANLHGNAAATAFAYQAFGGIRYRFNPHIDFSLSYEFLGSTRPEWDITAFDSSSTSGTLVLRNPNTHAVSLEFIFRF